MYEQGEPISAGRRDRRATEARALRNALFAAGLFAGAVLINGILAMLLIELLQAIGWWEPAGATGTAEEVAAELSDRARAGARALSLTPIACP